MAKRCKTHGPFDEVVAAVFCVVPTDLCLREFYRLSVLSA